MRAWGYFACVWCVLFAALHVYWAVGGDVGLASSAGTDLATHRPSWFVLLGLWGVALLLVAGAAFSVGMTRWRLRGRLRRVVVILGWLGGVVLLARGLLLEVVLLTGAGGIASAVGPSQTHWSLILWNPWFVLGGLVVSLATCQLQRA
ncbi:hypothetical protein GCM10029964_084520 [Kibdelosporangium lantanae]